MRELCEEAAGGSGDSAPPPGEEPGFQASVFSQMPLSVILQLAPAPCPDSFFPLDRLDLGLRRGPLRQPPLQLAVGGGGPRSPEVREWRRLDPRA